MSDAPIGIFDSGLGGLSVLKELLRHFPNESFIYLGDTARIPYGNKSSQVIAKYTENNIQFLKRREVKAVVVACNSASSVLAGIAENLKNKTPIYNVIEPGAEKAQRSTQNKKIGVIGTRATLESQSYKKKLEELDSSIQVYSNACPLLVPLVEEGLEDDPITNLIAFRYIHPLMQKEIDTLILGCTHFPFLKKAIQKVTGPSVALVDSAQAICEKLEVDFNSNQLSRTKRAQGGVQILLTDFNANYEKTARHFLGNPPNINFDWVEI